MEPLLFGYVPIMFHFCSLCKPSLYRLQCTAGDGERTVNDAQPAFILLRQNAARSRRTNPCMESARRPRGARPSPRQPHQILRGQRGSIRQECRQPAECSTFRLSDLLDLAASDGKEVPVSGTSRAARPAGAILMPPQSPRSDERSGDRRVTAGASERNPPRPRLKPERSCLRQA